MAEHDSNREGLLWKTKYYENCPGCRIDIRKETNLGIPYKDLFLVWVVAFTTFLPVSSLFPYLYFLVRDFNIANRQEDIGYYAGCIGCVYMIGRALTSVLWGILADRYGRKPIIILCSSSVIIFNALFGLSRNFLMAVSMRFLLGCFSGIFGPVQAYAVEVCREEYRTLALSVTSSAWAIGLIVGPVVGGFLAQPAEIYPNLFTKDSVFGRFPYFLPSLSISVCATAATVACFWLLETLHKHKGIESCEAGMSEKIQKNQEIGLSNSKESLFRNWPLISSIVVMCVFSLHNMAYDEIFSLWAVSPRKFGGLSYTTKDVGLILSVAGIGLFSFQLVLYPKLERILGPLKLARIAAASSIVLLSSYPFIAKLSGISLYLLINTASLLKSVFAMTTFTGFVILQNNTVSQHQRGAANGITSTLSSIFQAFGPSGGGALFSTAQKRINASFLPGTDLVFFALNLILVIGLAMSFKPFLALPQRCG
ncbi:hypothetical protein MKW98_015825 [Papaver atlanticum]|uniref:Major facilitator superfamily (MFS) profile domain-containing protein n=1 Tax=Papaver atlanticum TaxID=357466 RepID=A0AAD4XW26_9MAGN|nr:hypothetical protein MKW98_015825 [Papaver atlanticum]